MKQRPRRYFTDSEMALVWDRWQKGESLNAIARSLDRRHSAIQGALARSGGIRPAKRRRSLLALTLAEREEISRGMVAGYSIRTIASQLGRAPSTISREIRRNGDRRRYRANEADQAAWDRSRRPKICKLAQNCALARIVENKLCKLWAPEQIAGWPQAHLPGRREHAGITRDNLQEPVHPGPRGLEERVVAALEEDACHASLTSQNAQG